MQASADATVPQLVEVRRPAGVAEGQALIVVDPHGRRFLVKCPCGVAVGQPFRVQILVSPEAALPAHAAAPGVARLPSFQVLNHPEVLVGEAVSEDRQLMECPICFDELCAKPVAFLSGNGGRRVCQHLIHEQCCQKLERKSCPLCRVPFKGSTCLPSIVDDPDGWFRCVDVGCDGHLSMQHVSHTLTAQFPLDSREFEARLSELWPQFGADSDGRLTKAQFAMAARPQLLAYLKSNLMSLRRGVDEPPADEPPPVSMFEKLKLHLLRTAAQAPPASAPRARPPTPELELPDNIKPCPACGMLIEKVGGDDTMMCGCEAKKAGGTYAKALAGGGCGHEFKWSNLAPIDRGRPGRPANDRQTLFHRTR